MSHNTISINSVDPDRVSDIALDSSLAFNWRGLSSVDPGLPSGGFSNSYTVGFYRIATYTSITTGTGVSVSNSTYSHTAPQYQYGWFDTVELPEGEYLVNTCVGNGYATSGTYAWVDIDTLNKVSPIISTENNHNTLTSRFTLTAPSGGFKLGCKILSGAVVGPANEAFLTSHITIIKL